MPVAVEEQELPTTGDALRERELRRNFAAVLGLTRLRHGEGEGRPGELPACNKRSN
jgi:hypothetical protein